MKYINYHKRKQTTFREEGTRTRIPLRLWAIFLALIVANISVAVSTAAFGSELMTMEKEMKAVAEENKKIMESMVSEKSLQSIAQRAEDIGLEQPTDVVYLDASSVLTALR